MNSEMNLELKPEAMVRFDLSQRIQHIILITSFTILGLTGLVQSFFRAGFARGVMSLLGGLDGVRMIHHTFAVILGTIFVYHVVVVFVDFLKNHSKAMLPRIKDIKDAVQSVKYLLGRTDEKPQYDRFDFRQKLEYWALIWGTILMGGTGIVLMFAEDFSVILPGDWIYAAKAAHGLEALLAVASIITWHMYNTHLAEGMFPLDTTIFKGKISPERLMVEHPMEYQRMQIQAAAALEAEMNSVEAFPTVRKKEKVWMKLAGRKKPAIESEPTVEEAPAAENKQEAEDSSVEKITE